MDLYSLLGVARDATRDAIRSAFRRKVKSAHPDAGGDPVAFAQLCLANDVLSDEDRREAYDSTGATEAPNHEDYLRQHALNLLAELIKSILTVATDVDPCSENLAAVGQDHLTDSIRKLNLQLAAVMRAQERAKKMKGRWRPKESDQPNVLNSILHSQNTHLEQSAANIRGQIQAHYLAIEILKDHRFQYDSESGIVMANSFYQARR